MKNMQNNFMPWAIIIAAVLVGSVLYWNASAGTNTEPTIIPRQNYSNVVNQDQLKTEIQALHAYIRSRHLSNGDIVTILQDYIDIIKHISYKDVKLPQ